MKLPLYQVDAFTDRLFGGNPAAVCPLEEWLPGELMQAIAAENNLSETAFFAPRAGEDAYDLRWFTPEVEIDLCGHATLATAHVILERLRPELDELRFHSRSGPLKVVRRGEELELDFPAAPPVRVDTPGALVEALDAAPLQAWHSEKAGKFLALMEDEKAVRALRPHWPAFEELDAMGVIATARGDEVDFVSRFFAPAVGIPEDPVTGAAHCVLTPYWASILGRDRLRARQISARGGSLTCELRGERVGLAGRAVIYLEGTIGV
jgi:PhzF family phenazine biosynthesis protein